MTPPRSLRSRRGPCSRRRSGPPGRVSEPESAAKPESATRTGFVRPGAVALLTLLALLAGPDPARAQDWLETTVSRQITDQESLDVEVRYGAGQLRVEPAEPGLLYRARMRYDASRFDPLRAYRQTGGTASVRLGLDSGGDELDMDLEMDWRNFGLRLGDLDLSDLNDGRGLGGARLRIGLTRTIPTRLELRTGASEGRLELGGLSLERLEVATGASDTRISFSEPNRIPMEELRIRAGAAALRAERLGNARAREIRIENAVGDVTLDFRGEWRQDATARVKVGFGSLRLVVPEGLGVRIEKKGVLSSFDAVGFVRREDGYETPGYGSTEHRLDLEVEAALGSVSVEVRP